MSDLQQSPEILYQELQGVLHCVRTDLSILKASPVDATWSEKVAYLGYQLSLMSQTPCPVQHHFAPGVYVREIFMPAGTIVIGKIHRTEHMNLIDRGVISLFSAEGTRLLKAPCVFNSGTGVQKVLYIHEDSIWKTIHVTDETDIPTLERELSYIPDEPLIGSEAVRMIQ